MTNAGQHIIEALAAARRERGLSQRGLGAQSGVPQSHISKIESGAVDLQLSSLIELARVLGLELMPVPRKLVPAVESIIRGADSSAARHQDNTQRILKYIKRIRKAIGRQPSLATTETSHFELDRTVAELANLRFEPEEIEALQRISNELQSVPPGQEQSQRLRSAVRELRLLRNKIVHRVASPERAAQPAYSLDQEDGDA